MWNNADAACELTLILILIMIMILIAMRIAIARNVCARGEGSIGIVSCK